MKAKIALALAAGFVIGDFANMFYNREFVHTLHKDNEILAKHDKAASGLANLYCSILNKHDVPMDDFEAFAMKELLSQLD